MSEYIITDEQIAENRRLHGNKLLVMQVIVRCKDCYYYDHWDASGPYREKHVCGHWDYLEINPNGYCAWGERKDEDGC